MWEHKGHLGIQIAQGEIETRRRDISCPLTRATMHAVRIPAHSNAACSRSRCRSSLLCCICVTGADVVQRKNRKCGGEAGTEQNPPSRPGTWPSRVKIDEQRLPTAHVTADDCGEPEDASSTHRTWRPLALPANTPDPAWLHVKRDGGLLRWGLLVIHRE